MAANKLVYRGPGSISTSSGLLKVVLISDGKTLARVMMLSMARLVFNLAVRIGMGNLVAGMVFFGIGTWPCISAVVGRTIFSVPQGLQGRSG